MKIIRTPFFIGMSCCNSWCGYNPCCNPCYNPCYNPCCFCSTIVLGTPVSTNITGFVNTITLTLGSPSNGWTGSGSYVISSASTTTGSATFAFNGSCFPTSFTIPVTVSDGDSISGSGTLTVSLNYNCVTLSGTITANGSSFTFTGNGCLAGCGGNRNANIQNVTITGSIN